MNDVTIMRALGESENRVFEFQRQRNYTMVDSLAIKSNKQLDDETMMKAMRILGANFPILRARVVEQDGARFFKFMEKDAVDFEMISGDWQSHYEGMLSTPFDDEEGPMWRVKLLPSVSSSSPTGAHYEYSLLISWNHTITDGLSNVIFTNRLMEIISGLLENADVGENEISGISDSLEELLPKKDFLWSEVKEHVKTLLEPKEAAFSRILDERKRSEEIPRTKFIELAVFDEDFSSGLVKRCKSEGTTVHGALTAAIHEAVYHAISQATNHKGPLNVLSHHAVNMRRFIGTEFSESLGFMVVLYPCTFTVPEPSGDSFWQRAKSTTAQLRSLMGGDNLVKRIVTTEQLVDTKMFIENIQKTAKCVYDYTTSNMLDITGRMPGVYPQLTVESIRRSLSFWADGAPYFFNLTTFRGKMYLSVNWHTNYFREDEAKAFGGKVADVLRAAMLLK